MPKIEITELDLTTPGGAAEDFDVVYIPGLVDITQSELSVGNTYVGLECNKPTLFTTVKQFVSLCGKKPAQFEKDQYYTDLVENKLDEGGNITGTTVGFKDDAIPYSRTMFKAESYDPSYIMAKELLDAGICVLYERINGDISYELLTAEPKDWSTTYSTYYERKDEKVHINDRSAPDFYSFTSVEGVKVKDPPEGSPSVVCPTFEAGKYYSEVGDFAKPLSVEPTDWKDDYKSYYTRGKNGPYYKGVAVDGSNTTNYTELESRPDDWGTRFYNYYKDEKSYVSVQGTTAPQFSVVVEGKETKHYYELNDGINIKSIYRALPGVFSEGAGKYQGLRDKGNYSIKYLTSGGYPTYEYNNNSIVTKMISLAKDRGDCVAFIDHTDNPDRQDNVDLRGSVYYAVKNDDSLAGNDGFATMFTPYATYNRTTSDYEEGANNIDVIIKGNNQLRGSGTFAYLTSLADSIKTNAPWLAIAGATRGVVRNLAEGGMTTVIPNGAADFMQPREGVAVNAITEIKPYGNVIWGNRTLKNNPENLTATSFLNIRNLVSDVKKICYRTARKLTYEQNNDILWINFKSEIAPTLDRMLSGYGISGYKFVRDTEHEKANEKATLCAKIILYPVYPVEDFYITIVLKDEEITVE